MNRQRQARREQINRNSKEWTVERLIIAGRGGGGYLHTLAIFRTKPASGICYMITTYQLPGSLDLLNESRQTTDTASDKSLISPFHI